MKTLIWKEWKENATVATIALVGAVVLLVGLGMTYMSAVRALTTGVLRVDFLQPLVSEIFLLPATWFCALFGGVLGWLQIQHERHRDLWAFLVHRPMTRTQIFLGKSLVGIALYVAGTCLPLLLFVFWLRFLAPQVAPFEWAMLLPVLTSVLVGPVFYFAAMLVSVRQVRWYGSRGLPLIVALAMAAFIEGGPGFWVITGAVLLCTSVLAFASWGAFRTQGQYRGQPLVPKLALTGVHAVAGFWLGTILAAVLLNVLFMWGTYRSSSAYTVARDGKIYKSVFPGRAPAQIQDLDGKPVLDPASGRPIHVSAFNGKTARHVSLTPDFGPWDDYPLRHQSKFFISWRLTEDTAWYFWQRYGRLVAFDLRTQRLLGSLGPDGFLPGSPAGPKLHYGNGGLLWDKTGVYRPDLETRTFKTVFTTNEDDPIGGAEDFRRNGDGDEYTLVVTRRLVSLLTRDGKLLWRHTYAFTGSEFVQLFLLEPAGEFLLWVMPSERLNARADWKLPIQATLLASEQGAIKTVALPVLGVQKELDWSQRMLNLFRPAVLPFPPPLSGKTGLVDWRGGLVSLAVSLLVFVPLVLWLVTRYALPVGVRLGWCVFVLFGGFPAFIAFLSVQEWPAREPCASCRKRRVVEREQCEHCGAEFPPPDKCGTEIFAAAVTN